MLNIQHSIQQGSTGSPTSISGISRLTQTKSWHLAQYQAQTWRGWDNSAFRPSYPNSTVTYALLYLSTARTLGRKRAVRALTEPARPHLLLAAGCCAMPMRPRAEHSGARSHGTANTTWELRALSSILSHKHPKWQPVPLLSSAEFQNKLWCVCPRQNINKT